LLLLLRAVYTGDFVGDSVSAILLQPQIARVNYRRFSGDKIAAKSLQFEHARNFVQPLGDKIADKIARVKTAL